MVTDYHHLTPFGLWLKQNWDHQHLNDVLPGCHPTAEAIASYLFNAVLPDLLGKVPGWGVTWWVDSVGVSETAKTWAVYTDE
jgi:6-pyruvoyltetrahydropterin/6-carboxytetrahydropterin synthase